MRLTVFLLVIAVFALAVPSGLLLAQNVIPPISPLNISTTQDVVNIFQRIVTFVLQLAGIIAVIVIIYSGVAFMTAGDSEERRRNASSWLKWGIVGIVVVSLSYTIISIVASFLSR